MSNGGDELLRAVLDKSCTYSGAATYTIEQAYAGAAIAASVAYQAKQETYFLITSLTPYVIANAPAGGLYDVGDTLPVLMDLYDPSSSRHWSAKPQLMSAWGSVMGRQYTMPQYWMIEPASSIVLNIDPTNIPGNSIVGMMLNGIEYRR